MEAKMLDYWLAQRLLAEIQTKIEREPESTARSRILRLLAAELAAQILPD
jgi:hypothetical protein